MKPKRLLKMLIVLDIAQELMRDEQLAESHFLMAELALAEIVRKLEKVCCGDFEEILFGNNESS